MSQPTSLTEPADLLVLREDLTLPDIERRAGVIYAGTGLRHRALAHYFHFVDSRGLYQTAGFRSTAQWAAQRLGMSAREARDLLAAGKALPELPVINRAFAQGRLCWTKVRELIKVATPQHEQKWLEKAQQLTSDELALEVRLSKPGQAPRRRDDRKGLPEVRMRLGTAMPPDVYAMWEQVQRKASTEAGRRTQGWECLQAAFNAYLAQDGSSKRVTNSPYTVVVSDSRDEGGCATVETADGPVPISPLTLDLLRCDGHHLNANKPTGKGQDDIPGPLRRRVLARDRHRCRRCGCRDNLHLHHIIPRELGGPTEYCNLVTLCRYCHTLVHAGFIRIEGSVKKGLRFVDREGRELQGVEVVPAEFFEELTGGEVTVLQLPEPAEPSPPPALPAELAPHWWRAHEHLISFDECQRAYVLHPGQALTDAPADRNGKAKPGTTCRLGGSERFNDLIGQKEVIEGLELSVEVAHKLGEPLGHTLLVGAPGLGKTTLARVVAGELRARLHTTNGSLLQSPSDLVSSLAALDPRDVLFVDEIHAISKPVAEVLYEAMDQRRVRVHLAVSGTRHGVPLLLEPFTLIGATTEYGSLPDPFLSRFENIEYLRFYEPDELAALIDRAAHQQGLKVEPAAAWKLAMVSRQTPRRALLLLKRRHEPYLFRLGLITITSRGRAARAYQPITRSA